MYCIWWNICIGLHGCFIWILQVLAVYTFSKRLYLDDFENKPRKSVGYSTVSHFNVIHVDCHTAAVRQELIVTLCSVSVYTFSDSIIYSLILTVPVYTSLIQYCILHVLLILTVLVDTPGDARSGRVLPSRMPTPSVTGCYPCGGLMFRSLLLLPVWQGTHCQISIFYVSW